MKLKEYEALSLLDESGIVTPERVLLTSLKQAASISFPKLVIKAQTLEKKRAKRGLVIISSLSNAIEKITRLLNEGMRKGSFSEVLVEAYVEHTHEYYVSFSFDTGRRSPVIILSLEGGVDIEDLGKKNPNKVLIHTINSLTGLTKREIVILLEQLRYDKDKESLSAFILTLYDCFEKNDLSLLEINPFVYNPLSSSYLVLDVHMALDDSALSRHSFSFKERTGLRESNERERAAHEIDKNDYRGVAGRTYLDLDGDIALLASGGGASLTAVDSLVSYGGKLANYTEYSGNPSAEKVKKLTSLTLSKEGLCGCWVVGGTANFTDIYETLKGFSLGLLSISPKPTYPIVVRRAGPRDKEAFAMLRQFALAHGFDMHLHDESIPISYSAKIMVELGRSYKEKHGNTHR
ncbi:MAG TPA: ATP-grasp domain-containing protein [Candidatus Nanoarchaeia archaeon]|nr:ATP-grasp domain-containing protein [Candidatus Nanoarchaeia archaeon]